MKSRVIVAVSGGFDPLHIGHIKLFQEAKRLGDELVVILNSDRFLKEKKGYVFMRYNERKKILESIKYIDKIVRCIDKDNGVLKTLKKIKPDIFANGGDRKGFTDDEISICKKNNIKIIKGVGGCKVQSSSDLTFYTNKKRVKKSWGYEDWIVNKNYCGKLLFIRKGFSIPIHFHKNKDETFYLIKGRAWIYKNRVKKLMRKYDVVHLSPRDTHKVVAIKNCKIIEFSTHHEDSDTYHLKL